MKKFLALMAVIVLAIPSLALAAVFKADTVIPAGEIIMDNLYLAGGNPSMGGDVQGDLYIAGGNVVVTGKVAEDVVAAGGNISIMGPVSGDVRAFGGSIFIDSSVSGEVVTSGGEVRIGPNAQIRKDLVAAGGTVEVHPNAKIFGSKTIESGDAYEKGMEKFPSRGQFYDQFLTIGFWVGFLYMLLAYFAIAAVIFGLFPNVVRKVGVRAYGKGQFWPSVGIGFLVLIATPIAAVLCFITMIGAMLGGILMVAYAACIMLSIVMGGMLFGELLRKWIKKAKKVEPTWGWTFGGIALLSLLTLIPFIGWIIGLAFFLLAMGSMVSVKWKVARSLK